MSATPDSTAGPVWFVTGSSRGLGRAVAEEALAAGKRVVATARTTATLDDLVEKYGDAVLPVRLDVDDPAQAERAVGEAVDRFGRLDVVVNNAGYATVAPIEQTPLAEFRAQVETAFFGTVHVTMAALPVLRAQGSGYVIQVASNGARFTAPGVDAYQSAKFAVEGFSGVLRQEVGPLGIRVTLAEPGLMRTDWSGSSMKIPPMLPEYEDTVGALARHLRAHNGAEPIDPARVARVFLGLADLPEPPLHLILGRSAVDRNTEAMQALLEEDARWAELGRSVDFG